MEAAPPSHTENGRPSTSPSPAPLMPSLSELLEAIELARTRPSAHDICCGMEGQRGGAVREEGVGLTVITQFWLNLYVRGSDGHPLGGEEQLLSLLQRPHDTHTVKPVNGWTCSFSSLYHQLSHSRCAPGECSCECEASA